MATRADQYAELILASLNDNARRAMLEHLNVNRHQYQSEVARKYFNGGRREVLVGQLGLRFGELPAWALHRLLAADDMDLARCTARVLTAATLDAVFASGAPAAPSNPTEWNIREDFVGMCMKAGRIGGQQQMLIKILRMKFGELPEWARSQLRLAFEPDIELWTERVFTAATLEDVFAD
jgi:hypothetical protein